MLWAPAVVILLATAWTWAAATAPGPRREQVCPYCGASVSPGVTCPCGRSMGSWGYNTPRAADDFPKSAIK
ncbi:MAG TPA: hypothetical protein DEB31_01445 [Clostridiales bacterium]|nr:hypothetical protein [Clostridiales bacterium]